MTLHAAARSGILGAVNLAPSQAYSFVAHPQGCCVLAYHERAIAKSTSFPEDVCV